MEEIIDAILCMQPPALVKQVCSFIGTGLYYKDMYPHRSHLLTPLTNLTGKGRFVWAPGHLLSANKLST
jgi:hypothetical protein